MILASELSKPEKDEAMTVCELEGVTDADGTIVFSTSSVDVTADERRPNWDTDTGVLTDLDNIPDCRLPGDTDVTVLVDRVATSDSPDVIETGLIVANKVDASEITGDVDPISVLDNKKDRVGDKTIEGFADIMKLDDTTDL